MALNLDYKRIFLAILILIIGIGLIVGFFWLVFFRTPGIEPEAEVGVGEIGGILPGTGTGGEPTIVIPGGLLPGSEDITGAGTGDLESKIGTEMTIDTIARGSLTEAKAVIAVETRGITMSGNGFNYLSAEDDKFYRLSLDGETRILLADRSFPNTEEVIWSPDGKKVILEYPDGANIVYDFSQNEQTTLPREMQDPSWQKNSDDIAYKYIGSNEDSNWLIVSGSNGTGARGIEPLGDQENSVQVNWSPTSQVVALYHKPIGLDMEELFFIGLNDENFKSLTVQGSNFQGIWSPMGDRILYHVITANNDYNPTIWIADAYGDNIGRNNFNLGLTTWVDKCAFSGSKTVYCAVPIGLPEGAGIYPDLLNDKADVFYRIDLVTGISKLIAYPVLSEELDEFQIKKLFISDSEDRLYFWDGFTDKVYYLRLK